MTDPKTLAAAIKAVKADMHRLCDTITKFEDNKDNDKKLAGVNVLPQGVVDQINEMADQCQKLKTGLDNLPRD